jgi:primosomal protein N' (replication factor Y)
VTRDTGREIVRVALPIPPRRTFLYSVPTKLSPVPVGAVVRVPFGPRRLRGVVVESPAIRTEAECEIQAKPIVSLDESYPCLDEEQVELARFVSDYWLCSWGDALQAALPPAVRPLAEPWGWCRRRGADVGDLSPRATALRSAWQQLPEDGSLRLHDLVPVELRTSLKSLMTKGLVEKRSVAEAVRPAVVLPTPTEEQAAALAAIQPQLEVGRFSVRLLHGVTGSGKTEVYLRCAAQVLEQDRSVLYLVPEIALTPMLVERVQSRFGPQVDWMHSGRSAGERRRAWERAASGKARLIVGTRSAVFAPVRKLGLVIIDEEHDGSYKQDEAPRYHARDLAVVRARRSGSAVLLGSATPSLESYRHALEGRYELSELKRRVRERPLPEVSFVDMRDSYREQGKPQPISTTLFRALEETVERGEQAIILRNRRGWAPLALCESCGERVECGHCSTTLTWHKRDARLRCHLCGFETVWPERCPACRNPELALHGEGTERVEDVVRQHLGPTVRVERLDRDVSRRKNASASILKRFGNREIDVLVGTQMIAKGHDFPGVTLVGVLNADQSLGLPDFRAGERVFQLLTQVAGRAGRGEKLGRVVVQAFDPDHPILARAATQDYRAFYDWEIEYRRTLRYPPFTGLVLLRIRDVEREQAWRRAEKLVVHYRALSEPDLLITGPLPPVLERVRGYWRFDIMLRHTGRRRLVSIVERGMARAAADVPPRSVRIDVDPQSLM